MVVLSCDGKGIVMRPDALRPATATAAARSKPKLETRLSKGEKRGRKRMAEVGAVYDLTPAPRTAADILATSGQAGDPAPASTRATQGSLVVGVAPLGLIEDPGHDGRRVLHDAGGHLLSARFRQTRQR